MNSLFFKSCRSSISKVLSSRMCHEGTGNSIVFNCRGILEIEVCNPDTITKISQSLPGYDFSLIAPYYGAKPYVRQSNVEDIQSFSVIGKF